MKNILQKYLKVVIPTVLLFFLLQTVILNWQEVSIYLKSFQIVPLIISFLILLLIYPESALAWYFLIKKIGVKVSFKHALSVWIISNASRYIPGSIWQYVGRIELGQQVGISRKEGIFIVVYETILIAISGLLISLFTINYWGTVGIKLYMIVLGIGIPLLFLHPAILSKILLLLAKLSKKEKLLFPTLRMYDYILVLPLFLANFILNGLALMFLTFAFTGNLQIEKLFLFSGIYSLSWLVGYFSFFAPGGIGVVEVILTLLLSSHFPLPLASSIAIVYRFLLVIAEMMVFVFTLKIKHSKRYS